METPCVVVGVEHAGDPDAAGLHVLRSSAGAGEELRLLRVHQAPHRPLRHTGFWEVRRDSGESPESNVIISMGSVSIFSIINITIISVSIVSVSVKIRTERFGEIIQM